VRAVLTRDLELVGAVRSGDHRRAEVGTDGHGGQADTAGRPVHDQRLARPQPRPVAQGNMRSAEDDRERCAVVQDIDAGIGTHRPASTATCSA
jgi:hypothetical protein